METTQSDEIMCDAGAPCGRFAETVKKLETNDEFYKFSVWSMREFSRENMTRLAGERSRIVGDNVCAYIISKIIINVVLLSDDHVEVSPSAIMEDAKCVLSGISCDFDSVIKSVQKSYDAEEFHLIDDLREKYPDVDSEHVSWCAVHELRRLGYNATFCSSKDLIRVENTWKNV